MIAARNPHPPPRSLSAADVDRLVALTESMVEAADGDEEVTLPMVHRRFRKKVAMRVVANALHSRGYFFRKMREKPILTPDDVNERFKFAKKYRKMTPAWWLKQIHLHWDNKYFKVATKQKGRKALARRKVRGVYRTKGKSLHSAYVKPNAKFRLNTGARGLLTAGGVGAGRAILWHTIDERWNGRVAAELYKVHMFSALQRHYPRARAFRVLEDNDPAGNTSGPGRDAKALFRISHIPTVATGVLAL